MPRCGLDPDTCTGLPTRLVACPALMLTGAAHRRGGHDTRTNSTARRSSAHRSRLRRGCRPKRCSGSSAGRSRATACGGAPLRRCRSSTSVQQSVRGGKQQQPQPSRCAFIRRHRPRLVAACGARSIETSGDRLNAQVGAAAPVRNVWTARHRWSGRREDGTALCREIREEALRPFREHQQREQIKSQVQFKLRVYPK